MALNYNTEREACAVACFYYFKYNKIINDVSTINRGARKGKVTGGGGGRRDEKEN